MTSPLLSASGSPSRTDGGDFPVFALHAVKDGDADAVDEPAKERQQQTLVRTQGGEEFKAVVALLRERSEVIVQSDSEN